MAMRISKEPNSDKPLRFSKTNGAPAPVPPSAVREFHVSRAARELYGIDRSLFSFSGNVVFADFKAAYRLAERINAVRRRRLPAAPPAHASELNAMGLIDEIFHYIVEVYRREVQPKIFSDALAELQREIGEEKLNDALILFLKEFPGTAIYSGEMTAEAFLAGQTAGRSHKELALEEMIMLWLANRNPACENYSDLFSEQTLKKRTAYGKIFRQLKHFFREQPPLTGQDKDLLSFLRAPAKAFPDSLAGQLRYIQENWKFLIGDFLLRLLDSLDFIEEQTRPRFGPQMGPPPAEVPVYTDRDAEEPERFSPDEDWMPRVVLIARSALVWLDQLSKKYRREIRRLDQIPDEELDWLAECGFTSLWLIGLWERSPASRKIKQLCGNPDAEASAYALKNYEIAAEIGGWEALHHLRQRCWQRGIRLASDMVPNHTGIDSDWVIEHPDWFLQLPEPPFPSYSFNGPNLSGRSDVGVFLEEHYFDRSDAAVVFKREDFRSGETRYIYHGNDGTGMPWNDTAQLDYLKAEVREAVIQTILHVARNFPIIRFDAAMVLTKKHIQRLWYPEPGHGGDIPSRAGRGLTKREFDQLMPEEFWREVVERIAHEAPDTLLLAEAFWFMEGFFVRTLGMHRVYNSAFMNMLKNEENSKYRELIINTIKFNPEILKRYVNFMNNPDEETAVAQFGSGDKYFGVCTMLVTMPGLPMFGHGQVEGFHEKYGMEYRRAYYDEQPDPELVARHQREIFPLIHRRYLFANVDAFRLYNLRTPEGWVNPEVFAYSNRFGSDRALIIYHNKFASTSGWIKESALAGEALPDAAYAQNLAEGLALSSGENVYTIFRDYRSGLQYIRANKTLRESGLFVELHAYACHVFLDFREVQDGPEGWYARLNEHLNGRGVPDMEAALREIQLSTLHNPVRDLFAGNQVHAWREALLKRGQKEAAAAVLDEVEQKLVWVLQEVKERTDWRLNSEQAIRAVRGQLARLFGLLSGDFPRRSKNFARLCENAALRLREKPAVWFAALLEAFTAGAIAGIEPVETGQKLRWWFTELQMTALFQEMMTGSAPDDSTAPLMARLLPIWVKNETWLERFGERGAGAASIFREFLADEEIRNFLQIHAYDGTLWYRKETFELFLDSLELAGVLYLLIHPDLPKRQPRIYAKLSGALEKWRQAHEKAGFQVDEFLKRIK